nr:helix-turn-helix domain-containing protein [uncultured Roseibium sp.]
MKLLDISEVSHHTGIAASAIRHYEEKGLLTSVGRRGLKRLFGPDVLDRLALITLGKSAGFSLHEIKDMFGPDGRPDISREKLTARADELDDQIRQLGNLRDMIRHAAVCSAPSHMECPRFRKLLRVGSRSRQKARRDGGHKLNVL